MYYVSNDGRVWIESSEDALVEAVASYIDNIPQLIRDVKNGAYVFCKDGRIFRYSKV